MAKPKPTFFFLLLLVPSLTLSLELSSSSSQSYTPKRITDPHPTPSDFIKSSCRATRYPALCVHCLAAYSRAVQRSDRHLAQAALLVSLSRARTVSSYVAKLAHAGTIPVSPRELQAVRDCLENVGDAVDRLGQSFRELGHAGRVVGGPDFAWHLSNVETWVSAALTDESTCVDGFSGRVMDGKLKAAIRRRVMDLAQVTSNALALVNWFASRHRAVAAEVTGEP